MGNIKIRALLDGEDVIGAPYSEKSFEVRAIHDKYHNLNSKYGIYRLKDITTEGDDFVIEFDVANLGDSIDWDKLEYPDERVKRLVQTFIERHPLAKQLDDVLAEINRVTFADRYSLPRLGQKALDIIDKVSDSEYISYDSFRKKEAFSATHHTLGKEVEMVVGMRDRDSKKSKDMMLSSAIRHLNFDIDSYRRSMFWVKDLKEE